VAKNTNTKTTPTPILAKNINVVSDPFMNNRTGKTPAPTHHHHLV
jgi:hypothetical protein